MSIRLGYLLIDGFALMSYAPVMEPFRAANHLAGASHYTWRHYSLTGAPALASNGVAVSVDGDILTLADADILFICAGGNPALFHDPRTFDALRRAARFGTRLAGISGGPFILARAGLLDGYACTIHWEHEQAFAETFVAPRLQSGLFIIDRDRITCAGGLAGLELATTLIASEYDTKLARQVGDWYIQPGPRAASAPQRSTSQRYRVAHKSLEEVLELMSRNMAEPLDRATLARHANLSVRQLERLFANKLDTTIAKHYLEIRLERALTLLRQTALSITEVSLGTGFITASHFSRTFRQRYNITPTAAQQSR